MPVRVPNLMTSRNYNNLTFGLLACAAALGVLAGCRTKWAFKPIANPSAVRVSATPQAPKKSALVAIPPNLPRLPHMETRIPFGYTNDTTLYRWELLISSNAPGPFAHVRWLSNAFDVDVKKDLTVKTAFYRTKGYRR